MHLTQKIRIFPDKAQKELMWKSSEVCRKLYNNLLAERILCHENDYDLTWVEQQNTLPGLKNKNQDLKLVYSKVLQLVVRQVNQDIKSFISLQKVDYHASYPRFKGKKYFTTLCYNQSGFKTEKGFIYFSKPKLKIKIPNKFAFKKVVQISVFMKKDDYFLSVIYNKEVIAYIDNKLYQSFDLGVIKHAAVNMDGKFVEFINQRPDKYWQKKIESLQSRRDHCSKFSQKWYALNNNLKYMKQKCSRQLKDFQHKLSRKIVNNTRANTIIVGDLQIKQMSKKKKGKKNYKSARSLNRSIQSTGTLGRFVNFLTYKAELVGKKVVKISEKNTSKMCCCCGKMHNMPLSVRIMVCDCGNIIDRDQNSSVNIMSRFLSQNAQWTGYQGFLGNLRQTGILARELYSQEGPSLSLT